MRRRSGASNLRPWPPHLPLTHWNPRRRSFDNVVEAMGPNYLFLFGQLCLGLLHELPSGNVPERTRVVFMHRLPARVVLRIWLVSPTLLQGW